MFACVGKPPVPGTEDSDAVLATYIVRLVLAHEDCTAQLATIRHHLELNGVRVSGELLPIESTKEPSFLGLF